MTDDGNQDITVEGTDRLDSRTPLASKSSEYVRAGGIHAFAPGTVIGKYELLEHLDSGGMGMVYKARHTALGKVVALKVVATLLQSDPRATDRFLREMQAIGRITTHPNVLNAYDAGEVDSIHYIATELIEGIQLATLVRVIGSLSVSEACKIVSQAALALDHLRKHELVHRDIKPSNLMLTRDGTVKVVDLGLALLRDDQSEQITTMGEAMGSIDYMAPEQWMDSHSVDWRSDVYSLGCTFYYLLAGCAPYSRHRKGSVSKMRAHLEASFPDIRSKRNDVPSPAIELLRGMVEKDPSKRLTDFVEISKKLDLIASGDLKELAERGFSSSASMSRASTTNKVVRRSIRSEDSCDPSAITQPLTVARDDAAPIPSTLVKRATAAVVLVGALVALFFLVRDAMTVPETEPPFVQGPLSDPADVSIDQATAESVGVQPESSGPETPPSMDLVLNQSKVVGQPLNFVGHRSKVTDVTFLLSPSRLASISDDGMLCVFDMDDPAKPSFTSQVSSRAAVAMVYVAATDSLVIASEDGSIRVISASDGSIIRTESRPGVGFSGLARFPDREEYVSSDWNGDVRKTNLSSQSSSVELIGNRDEVVYDVDISSNGEWVAWGGRKPEVSLYRMSDQSVRELAGHKHWVYDVAFAPDASRLATAGHEGIVKLWLVTDGRFESEFACVVPQALRFFPDSRRLAVGCRDSRLEIWDILPPRQLYELDLGVPIDSVAVSSDSRWVVAGGNDGTLMAWPLPVSSP